MIDMTTPMGSWKTPAPGSGSRARTDSSEGFGSRRVYSSQVYWVTEVSVTWQLACSVDGQHQRALAREGLVDDLQRPHVLTAEPAGSPEVVRGGVDGHNVAYRPPGGRPEAWVPYCMRNSLKYTRRTSPSYRLRTSADSAFWALARPPVASSWA